MSILKKILIGVATIIILPFIIALFVSSKYAVEREIIINRPQQEVFDYIKYLKNQNDYSVWATKDPNMKNKFIGTDGTVGFISAWSSNNPQVGVGEQEITAISEGKRVETKIRFKIPYESEDNAYMITELVDSTQTKVKWGFSGKMAYPMNLTLLFMDMDEAVGNDLALGLTNLKVLLEKKSSSHH